MKEIDYWIWLINIPRISRKTIFELLNYYQEPKEIYEASETSLKEWLTDEQFRYLDYRRDEMRINEQRKILEQMNVSIVPFGSPDYPSRFLTIPDPPAALYVKGKMIKQRYSIAIVGARNATPYGIQMAELFARELAKKGVHIISGLASGIDSKAHMGALMVEGKTTGVLGCGIDIIYPKSNYRLFEEVEQKGAIISEHGPGVQPLPYHFPERNRLIAGLADAILVVEAKCKSGTMITVDAGLDQGKEIYALPGRITDSVSSGCNDLLRTGAKIALSPDDILEDISGVLNRQGKMVDIQTMKQERAMIMTEEEKMVYQVLDMEPVGIQTILMKTRMEPQELLVVLFRLEKRGWISQTRNYYYLTV